jgi:hypothetical protein
MSEKAALMKLADRSGVVQKMAAAHYLEEEGYGSEAGLYRVANGLDDPRFDKELPHCRERSVLCLEYISMLKQCGKIDPQEASAVAAMILVFWPQAEERWRLLHEAAARLEKEAGGVAIELPPRAQDLRTKFAELRERWAAQKALPPKEAE